MARARTLRRRAQRRAGRPPLGEPQSAGHRDAPARRGRAARLDGGGHRRGGSRPACLHHPARARPVHERCELAAAGTRPRAEAGPRTRRERAVPALQHRPAHRRQRRGALRIARAARRAVAGAEDATGAGRPQHGRPRHPQRVRGRGTHGARVARARARNGLPRHTAPRRAARTRRPGDRPLAGGQSLHGRLHALEPHAQRRHHGPAPRNRPRGRPTRTRPLRPPRGCEDAAAAARERAVLHDRRKPEQDGARTARLPRGDGLVPVASALGRHPDVRMQLDFPPSRQHIALGTGHLDLLSSASVYRKLREWLREVR